MEIYLVSKVVELFENEYYKTMAAEEAAKEINTWDVVEFDSETSGRDPHIKDFLCIQFGNKKANKAIVIDTTTIDIQLFKNILETKLLIVQNGKFDLQFCYKHNIIPRKVWDTMIVEQLLYLGYEYKNVCTPEEYTKNNFSYPYTVSINDKGVTHYTLSFGLAALTNKYLNKQMDKTVRGEIIRRGLDTSVIVYAATDVMYLEDIKEQQEKACAERHCTLAASLENMFVPVVAYLEWCGIKLDEDKWKIKMAQDQKNKKELENALNQWVINNEDPRFKKYIHQERQLDLFNPGIPKPKCIINWSSSSQVVEVFKLLGFNTITEDAKTGEVKDSIVQKVLLTQTGINDTFLNMYTQYKEAERVCTTYGQNYLDAINPNTGRIHTVFWQLGCKSGRMSCGSSKSYNSDLAELKKIPASKCKYVQLQNLPADAVTRESFVADKGNLFTSADYSALESRLGADIYNETEMLREFKEGSGDMHSLCAYLVFKDQIPRDTPIKDIRDLYPELRKKVKPIEFSQQFGGGAKAVASSLGCSIEEAQEFVNAYANGFKGISTYKAMGSQFVRNNGYIIMCTKTGHKLYWQNWLKWKDMENMSYQERLMHYDSKAVKAHNREGAGWDRLALNSVTQGTGAVIIKLAGTIFFKWVVEHNLFNKVLLCNIVHDEICIEYPKEMKDVVEPTLVKAMEKASAQLCDKLPIPAEASTGDFWIH